MEVREATDDDAEGIRAVARASLAASYDTVLSGVVVDSAVEQWYGEGFAADLADDDAVYLVVDDGDVVGFSQSHLVGERELVGEIAWLHVDPDRRGSGLGSRLCTETERNLLEAGVATFLGRVLAANEAGADFYEAHGYEEADDREVRIGEETFVERTFVKYPGTGRGDGVGALDERELPDGRRAYLAYDESDRGSDGPLYAAYLDADREERYGWYCSVCGSFDVAMDSMGRVQCTDCGNERNPTRWDASYG